MKMKLAVMAAVLTLTLSATGASRAADQAPFEINTIESLTGPAAFIGQAVISSLKVVESVVNRHGGINGRPVKFITNDDGSNPQVAVQLVVRLAAEHPPFILGPIFGATCAAVLPIISQSGPVTWCLSPSTAGPPGSYMFGTGASTTDAARALMRYFVARGWKRVAMLAGTDVSGQAFETGVRAFQGYPEGKALDLVAVEHMNNGDVSVAAQLARIKAANPQAVFVAVVGPAFATVMRGINDLGLDVPIGAANGNMLRAQLLSYKSFLPPQIYFPGWVAIIEHSVGRGPIDDAQKPFFAAFKEAGIVVDAGNQAMWDPPMILVGALRKLGTNVSPERLRQYLSNLHGYEGVEGIYDFRDGLQRGVGINAMVVDVWDRDKEAFIPVSRPGGYRR